jgi:Tol biopolymer transport system component
MRYPLPIRNRGYFADVFRPRAPSSSTPQKQLPIIIMPVAGGKPSKLVTLTGSDARKRTIGGIAWTPDGKNLIYAKSENTGYGLYQISVAGGAPQKLYYSKDPGFASLSVHPGGRQIALSTSVVEDEVWAIENIR